MNGIILSGWVLTLLTMIAIMGAALWLLTTGHDVPKALENWAGIALGFLFGTFTSIVKEYIS